MRSWSWVNPTSETDPTPVVSTITDAEFVREYWWWWVNRMLARPDLHHHISYANCIEDFKTVYWAEENKPSI
jgi:hypothetical protein